jgi:putative FmdB family regulatory protein
MPTYWYRCQKCKHEFEEFQKISDPPVKKCPKCDGLVMRVITGGAGLIFRGSGFYITDYRPDSYKKAEQAEKSSSTTSSSSSSSSSKTGSDGKA